MAIVFVIVLTSIEYYVLLFCQEIPTYKVKDRETKQDR